MASPYTDSSQGLFQGVLYIAERAFNGAQLTGFMDLGQVDMFTIDPKPKHEDIMDNRTSPSGVINHILTELTHATKFRSLDIAMKHWARSVWGEWTGAVEGDSVSGEAITLYNGCMTPLAHPGVSNVVISGAVLNTDYTVNAAMGAINVLAASSAVPDGTPLETTANYDFADYNGVVQAFTVPQKYFTLRLHGINVAQGGQPVIVTVRQWAPDPVAMLNFIDKKHHAQELGGMVLKDESIDEPVAGDGDLSQYFSIAKR
jgi:hypothetical protein